MTKISTPQANDWDKYWSADETQRFTKISWSKRRIIRILDRYCRATGRALDAGCGSGFFSRYFCEKNMQVTALDYSNEALAIAKRLTDNKIKTLQTDLTCPGLCDCIEDRFDVIFTDGLFEHFSHENQNAIMNNLKSVLKEEGVIVTFVPNKWSPWELIRPFFMPGIEEDPFVMPRLIDLNERNQLEVIEQGGINTFPFALSPDKFVGQIWGMLLYTVSKKQ